ncbi:MAG: T9SS type A sorting domain-containing protein [Marinilabiliales bacterium]|nr:T9SS type A sorting domain-containing protein [Marinilabiliales bacterium]
MDPSSGIGTVGAGWEKITCRIGVGELVGDEITGIAITFDKPASSGSYLACFDDILISAANNSPTAIDKAPVREKNQYLFTRNQTLVFNADALNSNVKIYDISGKLLSDFILVSTEVPVNMGKGIYIVKVSNKQGVYSQKIIL